MANLSLRLATKIGKQLNNTLPQVRFWVFFLTILTEHVRQKTYSSMPVGDLVDIIGVFSETTVPHILPSCIVCPAESEYFPVK